MIDLVISIVNYNTKELLKQCIESIYKKTSGLNFEIWVVDNASKDGSVEMINNFFSQVKLISNKENLFFAKAHNQMLSQIQARYAVILNTDTVLLNNVFKIMIDFMDSNVEAGACGPKLLNPDLTDQGNGIRFPSYLYGIYEVLYVNILFPDNSVKNTRWIKNWDRNDLREVDSIGGACMLVRKDVLNKVGLLDENFVAYWEETDWCLRIKKYNYKIYFLPEAEIIHFEQQSAKKLGKKENQKILQKSLLYYYKKHYGFIGYIVLKMIVILLKPLDLFKKEYRDRNNNCNNRFLLKFTP